MLVEIIDNNYPCNQKLYQESLYVNIDLQKTKKKKNETQLVKN